MAVLNWINEHAHGNEFINQLFKYITYLGGGVWLLVAIIFLFFKKMRLVGLIMLLAIGASIVVVEGVFKNIIYQTRPFEKQPAFAEFLNKINYSLPKTSSFPSLHACLSFACATVIARQIKGGWVYLVGIVVSISRVFLCVHYPRDVIVGALLGVVIGFVSIYLTNLFIKLIKNGYFKNQK